MSPFKRLTSVLRRLVTTTLGIDVRLDEIKINQGIVLSNLNRSRTSRNIKDYEFRVFSQWGEDGIIQHLVNTIEIRNRTFIEFGVEDFFESNCRFLLMKDDWKGFVIDGSASNIQRLKDAYFYWKHHLVAVHSFITRENINELLAGSGFDEDLGILSIDLDGNDYYVLDAITDFRPRILICEFNSAFGGTRKISIPYQADFQRTRAHHSNLYWGASLAAMTHLAAIKGYALVGTNTASNNAFYVRNDLLNDKLEVLSVEDAYAPSNYRESRDEHGRLSYLAADQRLHAIQGLPVFDVEKRATEAL